MSQMHRDDLQSLMKLLNYLSSMPTKTVINILNCTFKSSFRNSCSATRRLVSLVIGNNYLGCNRMKNVINKDDRMAQ